jgi:hypothetical protein
MMHRALRVFALANGALWLVLGVGWFVGARWALDLWPWPEVPMTFVFLASIGASIAVVWLAVAWSGEVAALAGVGLNILVAAAIAAWHLQRAGEGALAAGAALAALGGLALHGWARRQTLLDPRVMPRFVRAVFVLFTVVLVAAGAALVLRRQVFPWQLHASSAVLVGAIFLGAAAYFAHAAAQTRWAHAVPPLAGFLAYDLVLFWPYGKLLAAPTAAVDDLYGDGGGTVNLTSLSVYLTVLGASTAVALYFFCVHPPTRLRRRRAGGAG